MLATVTTEIGTVHCQVYRWEISNGLLRQYFPKGADLSLRGTDDLAAVAAALNSRPRKTLGWRTPAEALDEVLRAAQTDVATTS